MIVHRFTVAVFVGVGLAVAVALAFFASPFASSQPDGLERVAIDNGFADRATGHALGDGPLADYAASGIDNGRLSAGTAGLIGVAICFLIGAGVMLAVRRSSRRTV